MKRGLKDFSGKLLRIVNACCTNYPDEKGTERTVQKSVSLKLVSCTNYPDEKGTESFSSTNWRHPGSYVALITPMKRGLKGLKTMLPSLNSNKSCTNYPDEKGTERVLKLHATANPRLSCTNYPDEKGTESRCNQSQRIGRPRVALITPMKRGLKDAAEAAANAYTDQLH